MLVNGVTWFDDQRRPVNAHGACVLEHEGVYYLFGEHKGDDVNRFEGFACYSSRDLESWTFERIVLPVQPDGMLGPERVGERPKVMRCPSTGQFIMLMHTDDLGYTDPCVGIAVSDTPAGEYRLQGPIEHEGRPVRRWDIGSFVDLDGTAYLLVHEGDIYRLSEDYLGIEAKVAEGLAPGGESPAMFVEAGTYYLCFSQKTSWERNDNYYLSAPAIEGPWTPQGPLAPEGTLTFDSQCSFVLRMPTADGGARHLYLGDRWSFPRQGSAARQVWLPIAGAPAGPLLRRYLVAWHPVSGEEVEIAGAEIAVDLASSKAGESAEVTLHGSRVALRGLCHPGGGYAHVVIRDAVDSSTAVESYVDMYAKVAQDRVCFVSPELPRGEYTVRVVVTGESPRWSDKTRSSYGSTGCDVTVTGALVLGLDQRHPIRWDRM